MITPEILSWGISQFPSRKPTIEKLCSDRRGKVICSHNTDGISTGNGTDVVAGTGCLPKYELEDFLVPMCEWTLPDGLPLDGTADGTCCTKRRAVAAEIATARYCICQDSFNDYKLSAKHDMNRPTFQMQTFIRRIIGSMMEARLFNCLVPLWVPNGKIGITSDRDCAFTWITVFDKCGHFLAQNLRFRIADDELMATAIALADVADGIDGDTSGTG